MSWVVRLMPSEYWVCRTVCKPKLVMSTQGMTVQKLVATTKKRVAEAEHDQGAGGDPLQRDAVEERGQEDEDEARPPRGWP